MKKNISGFTLIETIIYIALLAFLMGAGISAAFYIIDSSQQNKTDVNIQAEGNFILRKLDWALTGAYTGSVNVVSATQLNVTKSGLPTMIFSLSGSNLQLDPGTGAVNLNSSYVKISGFVFNDVVVSGQPDKITASFNVNGKAFNLTKYLRK